MIQISDNLSIDEAEISVSAIRSSGAGGQNVNKVATAIQLRFDIRASSLPDGIKQKLLRLPDQRITRDGEVVIKSMEHRSQTRNYQAAIDRLAVLIRRGTLSRKRRLVTKPGPAARRKRLDNKTRRGQLKKTRRKVDHNKESS